MASMTEKRKLQRELADEGYSVSITAWPRKATYYKPDGEAMPNLPADPYSMANYMARGFTPFPPKQPVATVAVADTIAPITAPKAEPIPKPQKASNQKILTCEQCGFKAGNSGAMGSHQRKHQKETSNVVP